MGQKPKEEILCLDGYSIDNRDTQLKLREIEILCDIRDNLTKLNEALDNLTNLFWNGQAYIRTLQ